jgi:adenine phosphoribosyltransferase
MKTIEAIRQEIIEIQDFPIAGIRYKDITGLLKSPRFRDAVRLMGEQVEVPDYWAGIESRGFLFASALSIQFGGGIVLCRKKNKLPPPKVSLEYDLEYGKDILEVKPGSGKVVLVDDVLATGGTLMAADKLLKTAGYEVSERLVLINLKYLNNLDGVKSLIDYV